MSVEARSQNPDAIAQHLSLLEERVFQIHTKWPHFKLLLNDVQSLAEEFKGTKTIVSLERNILYGGNSLIAPFFQGSNFIAVECSPESADERGAYNKAMVDDPRFIAIPTTHRGHELETGLEDGVADLVLVPNLVHHIADQDALFAEVARVVKPGGTAYIFEPLVRELHQIPDDYIRYTPFGMENMMKKSGLEPTGHKLEGGPFSAVGYCWLQALEYMPESKREEMEKWFHEEHHPELLKWDEEFKDNLKRKHTKFPMSFSVTAKKP